ncbi:hypothetical protein NQ315_014333 [Exocentrus adspersus]|uniref:E2 ubiquitin-conjugating enzyme n=1 Tax=Exocentrus adspersus TaxID=1586481 RepID=A0AAV8VLD0_9CUCU|nr:hypothetical protein NQ315_014333 [Exocentrus adspersus]
MASTATMSNNVENLSPQIIRGVVKEMQDLVNNPPEGIKVQINEEDVTDIQAFIDGPAGTPYIGGLFKVKLTLGKGFPAEPPKAYFLTKIFHPNVAPNGEICVNTLKKGLETIKCLLIVPNAESALNEEAGKLLLEHYDDYSQRAKMMTEIHAQQHKCKGISGEGPLAKKHAGDKKLTAEKKKILKDKKRTLKRL